MSERDWSTAGALAQSVASWCVGNHQLLEALEQAEAHHEAGRSLYRALAQLGVLDAWAQGGSDGLVCACSAVRTLAEHSASAAAALMQQNLALRLVEAPEATGDWWALPLFDGPESWPEGLLVAESGGVSGLWRTVVGLPWARHALLPVPDGHGRVRLLQLELDAGLPSITMLGLRGLPVGDLHVQSAVGMPGAQPADRCTQLWSQAELMAGALRAGIVSASYATALGYARERWQGGATIIEHSQVQRMLAQMYSAVLEADAAWRGGCDLLQDDAGLPPAVMAQLLRGATQATAVASDGVQLLGGIGYMEDYPQARRLRDAKTCEFLLGHPERKRASLWQRGAYHA